MAVKTHLGRLQVTGVTGEWLPSWPPLYGFLTFHGPLKGSQESVGGDDHPPRAHHAAFGEAKRETVHGPFSSCVGQEVVKRIA